MLKSLLRIYDSKGTMIIEKDVDHIEIDYPNEIISFWWEEGSQKNEVKMHLDGLFITIN